MAQPRIPWVIPPVEVPFPLETVMSDSSGLARFREQGMDFELEKEGYERARIAGTMGGFTVKDSRDPIHLVLLEDNSLEVPLRKESEKGRPR